MICSLCGVSITDEYEIVISGDDNDEAMHSYCAYDADDAPSISGLRGRPLAGAELTMIEDE
jgi:hypothetical protein